MHKFLTILSRALLLSAAALSTSTYAVTPAEQLAALSAQAATAAQPTRGQQFFASRHAPSAACNHQGPRP